MDRLQNLIAQKEYELSCLKMLSDILNSGCCTWCKNKKECAYVPKRGEITRFNCPFFKSFGDDGGEKNV